jgi:hypothetical protein
MAGISSREKFLLTTCAVLIALTVFLGMNATQTLGMITGYPGSTKEKVSVDFFAMSMCRHCAEFEPTLKSVADLLGDGIRLRIFYVATESNGTFTSMHGPGEVDEDIRQVCINEYYPDRLLDYMLCAAGDYGNPAGSWEGCAEKNGIDRDTITSCWQGDEGRALFSENIKKTDYLKITKSPALMINKQVYTGKRSADAIKFWICDEFESQPKECGVSLEGGSMTGAITGVPEAGFCETP